MSKHENENAKEKDAQTAACAAENPAPGGNPAENGPAAPESGAEKIAALEARLAEANDQFLRKAADFENYRKRMIREKQDAIDYANQSLLLDLIQTMDDFERALKAAESCFASDAADRAEARAAFKTFYEGVSMIEKRLSSQLENKWGLKRFDSLGKPFDPNLHEALMMDKSPDISEPTVDEEFYKGYTLKERVVRSAKVKVLMPADGGEAPSGTEGENAENSQAKNQ